MKHMRAHTHISSYNLVSWPQFSKPGHPKESQSRKPLLPSLTCRAGHPPVAHARNAGDALRNFIPAECL